MRARQPEGGRAHDSAVSAWKQSCAEYGTKLRNMRKHVDYKIPLQHGLFVWPSWRFVPSDFIRSI